MVHPDDERIHLIIDELEKTRQHMTRIHDSLIGEVVVIAYRARNIHAAISAIFYFIFTLSILGSLYLFALSEIYYVYDQWIQRLLRLAGFFAAVPAIKIMFDVFFDTLNEDLQSRRSVSSAKEPLVTETSAPGPAESQPRGEGYALIMEKYRREVEVEMEKRRAAPESRRGMGL